MTLVIYENEMVRLYACFFVHQQAAKVLLNVSSKGPSS